MKKLTSLLLILALATTITTLRVTADTQSTVTPPAFGDEKWTMAEIEFPIGSTTGRHAHEHGDEVFFVSGGTGYAHVGGNSREISEGDFLFVPRGTIHEISNPYNESQLSVVFFMDGAESAHDLQAITN